LVEDQPEVLDVTMMMLEQLGYTVLGAAAAQDAVNLSKQHPGPIHLLITDVVMPNMNGKDLAATLTAQMPGRKCLLMYGYTPQRTSQ
jgi:CheY-like chemotaxis protein